jgi:hypothetical protein
MMAVGMLVAEMILQHAQDGREIFFRTANHFYGRRWHGTHHDTIDKALGFAACRFNENILDQARRDCIERRNNGFGGGEVLAFAPGAQ